MTISTLDYPIVRTRPVANFRYKGSHSKPVRRQIVLTEVTRSHLTGYEVREGNEVREITDAEIKTFDRSKIVDGTLSRTTLSASGIDG